jgi:hypothetical protein
MPMPDFPDPHTDYRAHPERYRIGRGERGVFHVEPYKSELLPHWRFKTLAEARTSAEAIWQKYEVYREAGDFVGMDMARKYLQMGYTRSMRYAKYPGGRKRDADGTERPPKQWADPEKREAALLFKARWDGVRADPVYQRFKAGWQQG